MDALIAELPDPERLPADVLEYASISRPVVHEAQEVAVGEARLFEEALMMGERL